MANQQRGDDQQADRAALRAAPLLSIEAVGKRFGGVIAVDSVTIEVQRGTIVGLIGPNGSGKTTLLNIVNGKELPDYGQIRLDGVVTRGRPPSELVARGLSRTFQSPRVFATLSVRQNLFVPLLHHGALARAAAAQRIAELLALVGLEAYADCPGGELSGGQQKLLEFARALVSTPRMILMDEPFGGVHPQVKQTLIRAVRDTVDRAGASFLIVSHEVPDLVALSDFMLCMVGGRVAASGAPSEVVRDEAVLEGYLGRGIA